MHHRWLQGLKKVRREYASRLYGILISFSYLLLLFGKTILTWGSSFSGCLNYAEEVVATGSAKTWTCREMFVYGIESGKFSRSYSFLKRSSTKGNLWGMITISASKLLRTMYRRFYPRTGQWRVKLKTKLAESRNYVLRFLIYFQIIHLPYFQQADSAPASVLTYLYLDHCTVRSFRNGRRY